MKDRVYYEVDPFNRLVIVKKFRQVVLGRFGAGRNNALYYEVNKSAGIDVPQKIEFSGKYNLDKGRNLTFTLNKWNNQCEGNRLVLKTRLMDAKSNELAFLMNSKEDGNKTKVYMLKLYGSWQADARNRLMFGVERDANRRDRLTLNAAWEINNNNEITYKYSSDSQIITLKGHWNMNKKGMLSYSLDRKINSGFDFAASLGVPAPENKDKYISFDIGIGLSKARKVRRKIIFSGKWKMGKGKELLFETSGAGEKGLKLKFTRDVFDKAGLAYIEALLKDREKFIGGGIAFRW